MTGSVFPRSFNEKGKALRLDVGSTIPNAVVLNGIKEKTEGSQRGVFPLCFIEPM